MVQEPSRKANHWSTSRIYPCPKDVFQHLKRHDDTRDARAISALFSQPVFKPQNRRQLILCHRLA